MAKTKSTIFHDKVAEKYESEYSGNKWKLYFDITYANMKKYLPKKKSLILDAGGGTGFWSRKLAKLGYVVICTDISKKMLDVGYELAKKENVSNKIEFKKIDIMNMVQFKSGTFDFIIAEGDPVGYCGNPDKAIKELSRVAKKGSYVIISIDSYFSRLSRIVANQDFKQLKLLEKKHKTVFPNGDYLEHDFTIDELKKLLNKNKLTVVEIIGKPLFARLIPRDKVEQILSDKKTYKKILNLEQKYNNEPSIVGFAGHIQVIGRKK